MAAVRVVDVLDSSGFSRIPPWADPRFDHRTCDSWEDADRGSESARSSWLEASPTASPDATERRTPPANPFLADLQAKGPAPQPVREQPPESVPRAG
jgi:hypothetical protein